MDRNIAGSDLGIASDKAFAARDLAKKHSAVERGIIRVFRLIRSADIEGSVLEPIKLLVINEATIQSGVMPLYFGSVPDSGIPYPSIIIEVTPQEFERVKTHELKLPEGWVVGDELLSADGSRGP